MVAKPNQFSGFGKFELFGKTVEEIYNSPSQYKSSYTLESELGRSPTQHHPDILAIPLTELLEASELVDSLRANSSLVSRANEKLLEGAPSRAVIPTELHAVKIFVKAVRNSVKLFRPRRVVSANLR